MSLEKSRKSADLVAGILLLVWGAILFMAAFYPVAYLSVIFNIASLAGGIVFIATAISFFIERRYDP